MDDVPFDLRPYRYIKYEQSTPGLRQLKRDLIESIREVAGVAYRFSVKENDGYAFPKKLFGRDRAKYEFKIEGVWILEGGAKFFLQERRCVLGKPAETIREDSFDIPTGGAVELTNVPWKLVLNEVREGVAYFRVVAKKDESGDRL